MTNLFEKYLTIHQTELLLRHQLPNQPQFLPVTDNKTSSILDYFLDFPLTKKRKEEKAMSGKTCLAGQLVTSVCQKERELSLLPYSVVCGNKSLHSCKSSQFWKFQKNIWIVVKYLKLLLVPCILYSELLIFM